MGRVVRAQGLEGEVTIRLETDVGACVEAGRTLYVGREGSPPRPLRVQASRVQASRATVKFGGVQTREEAEALVGRR